MGLANEANASLITTEKDWVRLNNEQKKIIQYLPIIAEIDQQNILLELCQKQLFLKK